MTPRTLLTCIALCLASTHATAALDLARAKVERLHNGLSVIVLEERSFPLVSVQMLYRSGARDDVPGKSGLAHFVEHMAFRGSDNFPGTGLVSGIYAAGGEWHGYTYLDQTTYFATVPADTLRLLLRIEADRMTALAVRAEDIPAEQGAVLAEMQGYENDPAAVLHDAAVFTSLLTHPYRNNTIGFAEDVLAIDRSDVVDFYRQHYQPGNAVLAIVGDIDGVDTLRLVRERFGDIPGHAASALPVTREPLQTGAREHLLRGSVARQWFQMNWRAPAATDDEWPAFLLLQELLAGSAGVNFLHNDWGTPARPGRPLSAVSADVATWLMPTAQPYVFAIKGSIAADGDRQAVAANIRSALAMARNTPYAAARFERARASLLRELVLDVQTTEDAAHQLAFFQGIDALDPLMTLPARIRALQPADVQRVAERYLQPAQMTAAWYLPGSPKQPPARPAGHFSVSSNAPAAAGSAVAPATLRRVGSGMPVILQPSSLSPTFALQVVFPGSNAAPGVGLRDQTPIPGSNSWLVVGTADEVADAIRRAPVQTERPSMQDPPSGDPYTRLEQVFAQRMAESPTATRRSPVALALTGDFDAAEVMPLLEDRYGQIAPASLPRLESIAPEAPGRQAWEVSIPAGRSQARVGYIVPAPAAGEKQADAWRALLYLFSHDYGGRLGQKAISQRGLAYFIDARYRAGPEQGWVTLSAGVAPAKLDAFATLLRDELQRLRDEPPDRAALREAVSHRIGRARSAHQANDELADELLRQWLWHGRLVPPDALQQRLQALHDDDLRAAIEAFTAGTIIRVTVGD